MSMKKVLFYGLAIILLAACGVNENDPAAVSRALTEAVIKGDGNTISRYICQAKQREFQTIGIGGGLLNNMSIDSGLGLSVGLGVDVDLRELNYRTTTRTNSTAEVHITGQLRMSVLGFYESIPVNDRMRMIHEDGRWKHCPL